MKVVGNFAILALSVLALPGCGPEQQAFRLEGRPGEIVAANIKSAGGMEAFQSIGQIRTFAVVTIYTPRGEAYVNRQQQLIDILAGTISARAITASRQWKASYNIGGRFSISNPEALDLISPDQLRDVMAVILHRVRGPFNLISGSEPVTNVEEVYLEGQDLVRLDATSEKFGPLSYYFDAVSSELRMLATGDGTVSLYTYQTTTDGIVFPKTISVFRTGKHSLVSDSPVLAVEFAQVQAD